MQSGQFLRLGALSAPWSHGTFPRGPSSQYTSLWQGRETMRMRIIGLGLAVAAMALICAGLSLGQEMGVFQKAIFICMECIGIG